VFRVRLSMKLVGGVRCGSRRVVSNITGLSVSRLWEYMCHGSKHIERKSNVNDHVRNNHDNYLVSLFNLMSLPEECQSYIHFSICDQ
jgi:hypothetical protein